MFWLLVDDLPSDPTASDQATGPCFALPLCARTADLLAGWVIEPTSDAIQRLVLAAQVDPALLWWVLSRRSPQITDWTNLSEPMPVWVSSALARLRDSVVDTQGIENSASQRQAVELSPSRVGELIAWATLATALARQQGVAEPLLAGHAALLRGAPLELEGLRDLSLGPLQQQQALLSAVSDAESLLANLAPSRKKKRRKKPLRQALRAAKKAERRWLKPSAGAGSCLLTLLERFSRLDTLERQFAETLEREKLEAMAEFAAGAGHEINNPVAVISGRAQLLLRGEQDLERQHDLAVIGFQATRIYEMIADTMLFARPPAPEIRELDLAEVVAGVVAERSNRAVRQQVELRWQPTSESLRIHGDAVQLGVALRAVIDNALDAVPAQGKIELSATSIPSFEANRSLNPDAEPNSPEPNSSEPVSPEFIQLTIRDTGPGFAPEIRRHLFDPYFSGRQAGRGLGLGLSKCWRIVTNHGGEVRVENASEPQGGVVHLLLPLKQAMPRPASQLEQPSPAREPS